MKFLRATCCILLILTVQASRVDAQVTNLSGVVNTYLDVTAVDMLNNALTVDNAAGLAIGDTVFIIQMQGASMNTTNTAAFGDITGINSAGSSEFNIICGVSGNVVTLERLLTATYDAAGAVQMIPVNVYANVNITGTLQPQAWNGNTGGVVLIAAPSGYVKLSANIDVRDRGFRGGTLQDLVSGCSCANAGTQYMDYFYPAANWRGAYKGEGIAAKVVGMESGRGKQVNGGGGANDHNAGGAGGANYGAGGNGGNASASSCILGSYCRGLFPGIGGLTLGATYYASGSGRLFMGGGGGSGDYGNSAVGAGSPGGYGANGAGIVIIWADSIDGNGFSILANGTNIPYLSAADGGGGGGAGGTVVLDARAFSSNNLTVNVNGGNGANHSWSSGANNCKGTGGGGGGGAVLLRAPANPPVVAVTASGGIAGVQGGTSCSALGNAGATNGSPGGTVNNFLRTFASAAYPPCVLPVVFSSIEAWQTGDDNVQVSWSTASETNNRQFEVERSLDGSTFGSLAVLPTQGADGGTYGWLDENPAIGNNWYRVRQVDEDGRGMYSETRLVYFEPAQTVNLKSVYPNPVESPSAFTVEVFLPRDAKVAVTLCDVVGKCQSDRAVSLVAGMNSFEVPTAGLAPGIYLLRIHAGALGEIVHKLKVN